MSETTKSSKDVMLMLTSCDTAAAELNDAVHRKIMDIMLSYVRVRKVMKSGGSAGLQVLPLNHDEAVERGLGDEDELYRVALDNTARMFPPLVQTLDERMICITNRCIVLGASAILYRDQLLSVSRLMGSDMYIVPFSMHQMICIEPDMPDPGSFCDFIREFNRKYMRSGEALSDSLYYYDAARRRLTVAYSNKCAIANWIEL